MPASANPGWSSSSIRAKPRVAAFLLAHCHAWGAAAPHLPVLELLRASCGIAPADTDSAEDVVLKVGAATRAMGMGDDERDVLVQFLGMKVDGGSPRRIRKRSRPGRSRRYAS